MAQPWGIRDGMRTAVRQEQRYVEPRTKTEQYRSRVSSRLRPQSVSRPTEALLSETETGQSRLTKDGTASVGEGVVARTHCGTTTKEVSAHHREPRNHLQIHLRFRAGERAPTVRISAARQETENTSARTQIPEKHGT